MAFYNLNSVSGFSRPHQITGNVGKPVDYVQVDYREIRNDAVEWGVSTSAVENIMRLTPAVFRAENDSQWRIDYDLTYPANEANISNCNYCLDTLITFLMKKHEHENAKRWPSRTRPHTPPTVYVGHAVYSAARTNSVVMHYVQEGYLYTMNRSVSGFADGEEYFHLTGNEPPDDKNPHGKNFVHGYLLKVEP